MDRLWTRAILATTMLLGLIEASGQEQSGVFHFLSLPSTTKAMALGGATTTIVANDAGLALESPALYGREHHGQMSLSYTNYWSDSHIATATYGRQFGAHGAWAVGMRYISYGQIEGRDLSGAYMGRYGAKDLALQATYSHELTEYLRLGISIKGIYSALADYRAYGLGADVGLSYYSQEHDSSAGIALTNIGALLRPYSTNRQEALPWDLRVGYSHRLAHAPFKLHLTAYGLRPRSPLMRLPDQVTLSTVGRILRHLALGVEYAPSDRFWLGMGYNPRIAQDYKSLRGASLAGLSAGVGFDRVGYRAAVSVTVYDSSFWAFMATFSTDFGLFNRR